MNFYWAEKKFFFGKLKRDAPLFISPLAPVFGHTPLPCQVQTKFENNGWMLTEMYCCALIGMETGSKTGEDTRERQGKRIDRETAQTLCLVIDWDGCRDTQYNMQWPRDADRETWNAMTYT